MAETTSRRRFIRNAGLASAGLVAAPAIVRAQDTIRWQAQSMWSAAELTYKAFEDFCAKLTVSTGGRLVVEPFAAGSVVGVFETLDAVSAGLLQAHSSWPGYFSGKDAGLAVLSDFVFGYENPFQADAWYHYRGGLDLLRQAYAQYNVYPVGVSWWGVESLVSKKVLNSAEDFKGVNIRSPQGMTAEILTKLGANIIVLPGGEVFSALDKGVVDAADWGTLSMNERMGFSSVAPHPTKIFHSMPAQEFSVNMDAWNALPDDLKALVATATREWTVDQVQRVAVDDIRVAKELEAKGIVTNVWGGEKLQQLRDLAQVTWVEWSGKTPLAKQAYDMHTAWLKELGLVA